MHISTRVLIYKKDIYFKISMRIETLIVLFILVKRTIQEKTHVFLLFYCSTLFGSPSYSHWGSSNDNSTTAFNDSVQNDIAVCRLGVICWVLTP